jgi:glycosyltransferase involved in cell wall biosynthesis
MIRILQVASGLHFGGAENVIARLVTGYDKEQFEVSVFCTKGLGAIADRLRAEGVRVTAGAAATRLQKYLSPVALWREIRAVRPDIVHSHGIEALAATGPLAVAGLLPKWMHTFHFGNYPYDNARHMAMEGFFSRRCHAPVAVSHAQRAALVRYHRLPEDMRVIWNGVPSNPHLGDAAMRQKARQEFGFTPDQLVVGTVAVLSEQKGIPFLLEAAGQVCAQHPDVRFLVVGGGHGEQERQYRRIVADLGIADRMVFTGWRPDAQELLMGMDVWVMSSLWEAMPLALLEAMSAARAIVVTDVGDNARLVTPGQSALVVPSRNGTALGTAIDSLLRDPARRDAISAAARREFEQKFTVDQMLRAYAQAYEVVAASRGLRGRG